MTYEVVELLADGLPNGFGVTVRTEPRGKRKMLTDGNKISRYITRQDAEKAGRDFIAKSSVGK
jgi:hypothetical protein